LKLYHDLAAPLTATINYDLFADQFQMKLKTSLALYTEFVFSGLEKFVRAQNPKLKFALCFVRCKRNGKEL
jgi:hypothetical protein